MLLTGKTGRSVRRALTIFVALSIASGLMTACGAGDNPGAAPADTTTPRAHGGASAVFPGARRVEVTARSFRFDPEEITVDAGEDIAIVLTSEDSLHDFTLEEVNAHISAEVDETAVGGFRADTPGRYTFSCSIAGHREAGMRGVLTVEA